MSRKEIVFSILVVILMNYFIIYLKNNIGFYDEGFVMYFLAFITGGLLTKMACTYIEEGLLKVIIDKVKSIQIYAKERKVKEIEDIAEEIIQEIIG